MAGPVLVVDDDPSVSEALRRVLPSDVELATAHDAATATLLLDEQTFCGIVLDLVLTEGTGFDVLRHMKDRRVVVPTVIVGERLPLHVREMLDEEQVKLVFPKPIEPRLLAAVVLGLCGIA